MTRAEVLAAVLAEHSYTYPDSFCECGAMFAEPWREWRAHVAAALDAALAAQEGEHECIQDDPNAPIFQPRIDPDDYAQEGERGGAEEPWPFGAEQAARLIASVSWPNEREENRDRWAVRMLTDRPDLFDTEAPRARSRLESAIRAVADRIAGDQP